MRNNSEVQLLERQRVYDGFQRILHAAMGLSILILITTGLSAGFFEPGGERAVLWELHFVAGNALTMLLFLRFCWGWLGPFHARWRSYLPRRADLELKKLTAMPEHFGHPPGPALVYLLVYFFLSVLSVTGFVLMGMIHGQGPLAEALFDEFQGREFLLQGHALLSWLIISFVGVHIAAIVIHETRDGLPISQSMISGYQYRKKRHEQRRKQ